MGKLVILKLGEGAFEQGFTVTLQIGEENARPFIEVTGQLPPDPEVPRLYHRWRSIYYNIGFSARPVGQPQSSLEPVTLADCHQAAQELCDRLNTWLQAESFRPIREKWLEKLLPSDEVRVLLQAQDPWILKLPWHLWEVIEHYPKAEIALSAPIYEQVNHSPTSTDTIRILAILGNAEDLNLQADRALLERITDADLHFLVEPSCQDLTDRLWEQHWDILFFAGHSTSDIANKTGRIHLNQTESLSIEQLKYALKKSVERGLKLAIFNSCDGLGLAQAFADLHIPQLIVMREPVPDRVAEAFLRYFLEAFARRDPLYLAVREARERLQALESQFPCATWLPIIYQNPAEPPITWQSLRDGPAIGLAKKDVDQTVRLPALRQWRSWARLLGTSLVISAIILAGRFFGGLQPLELKAFDHLMQLRPSEGSDSRLLVVRITEADFQALGEYPLSDHTVVRLLQRLDQEQPRVIGLDLYRDIPLGQGRAELTRYLQQSQHLIAVCKPPSVDDTTSYHPPPGLATTALGFSDIVEDDDQVVRRQLLHVDLEPATLCDAPDAFSLKLALKYLQSENITPTESDFLQLREVTFKPLDAHRGGYQNADLSGHQVLLNYRPYRFLQDIAPHVTLSDVFQGKVKSEYIKNHIVLIGVDSNLSSDRFRTPYSVSRDVNRHTPGVFVHAQMVSYILSAVLDRRSLLWVMPVWGDALWIGGWAFVGGTVAWGCRSRRTIALSTGIAIGILYASCFGILLLGGWFPLIPALLSFGATAGSIVIYKHLKLGQLSHR
jgi:CHASE2 domain-containing sensor protein